MKRLNLAQKTYQLKWLLPGLGIKRWIVGLVVGLTLISLGLAYLLVTIYREAPLPVLFYWLTLQFLPRVLRAILFSVLGLGIIGLSLIQIYRALTAPLVRPGTQPYVDLMVQHRQRERGVRVVAIGGGHGLSTLLRGLKHHTSNITAIVTVADDGGSSGRLRRDLGVLPPGDFRNCIAALADDEALTTQLFQYRFGQGEGLEGHSFGNLFIAAMAAVTGSFERALLESSRVLAVQGRILPSTVQDVTLVADIRQEVSRVDGLSSNGAHSGSAEQPYRTGGGDGALAPHSGAQRFTRIVGESRIPEHSGVIERVWLQPQHVRAYPGAVRALLDADLIVIGPGSLYTSVLPNLLVPDIAAAVRASSAVKVYVCNVATQRGETEGFTVARHVAVIEEHVGRGVVDYVIANDRFDLDFPSQAKVSLVSLEPPPPGEVRLITADVADERRPWRHDSAKLAAVLLDLYARVSDGSARTYHDKESSNGNSYRY